MELTLTIIQTTPNSPVKLIVDSVVRTVPLLAISSDGALKPCRELSVKRRKTHYSCRCWLCCAAPVSPFDLQQGWNSKANTDLADLYLPTDKCSTDVRTYVIIIAVEVEMPVDYQLFNQEGLFLLCIGFIDGLLPQVYREPSDVRGGTEEISEGQYFRSAEELKTPQQRQKARVFLDVSPIIETVGSSNNPARRDERTTTKETPAKDCCDPGVWLYICERAVHDFVGPPFRLLTTWQLCKDTHEFREEKSKRKTKNNTHNNSELPVSSATGCGGTVVLGPVMEQKQRSEHSSTWNAGFLSFSVRLTHGNSTEFPHDSSSPADITPGSPALVRISRIGWEH